MTWSKRATFKTSRLKYVLTYLVTLNITTLNVIRSFEKKMNTRVHSPISTKKYFLFFVQKIDLIALSVVCMKKLSKLEPTPLISYKDNDS